MQEVTLFSVRAWATLATSLVWGATALAAEEGSAALPPAVPPAAVSPDARRYLPAPTFSHWSGAERTFEGELSPAQPRPMSDGLLPALTDELETSAFTRGAYSHGPEPTWRLLELSSMHEVEGGSVLAANFRFDERETRAVQGALALTLPLDELWLVPLIELGAGSSVAPRLRFANEVRSNREVDVGYSFGFEGSEWSLGRRRMLAKVGIIARVLPTVAVEQRVLVGVWRGPGVDGDLALQAISAATQRMSDGLSLYERVTLSRRAPALHAGPVLPDVSDWSVDAGVGVHYSPAETWGVVLASDFGWRRQDYSRVGVELTLYTLLF